MGYEITGISSSIVGVQWQKTEGDKKIARDVVTFLEDRRLLFGDRHCEDEAHCIASALEIRTFLTEQIGRAKSGKELEGSLRFMRTACRQFVEKGGPHGRDFFRAHSMYEADGFGMALGDLRTSIGHQLAVLLSQYPMPIEHELAGIVPKADDDGRDLDWLPGFGESDD